jgi:transposase
MSKQLQHKDLVVTEELDPSLPPLSSWMKQAEWWRVRAIHLSLENSTLRAENEKQALLIADLHGQVEALTAKLKDLAHRIFGRKTEKEPSTELPTREVVLDLSEQEKHCQICGLPFPRFPGMEESEQIDWRVTLERVVTRRPRYRKTCSCPGLPAIITAPLHPKLIKKGMFTVDFIVKLLVLKYLLAMPMNRIKSYLRMEGLILASGTLAGVMESVIPFLEPLYSAICARNAASDRLKADETGWKVFTETTGKKTHRWWLWVFASPDTAAFILSPSRSSETPKNHLDIEQDPSLEKILRIMLTDFYSAYRVLKDVLHAWCWAHMRRKFIDAARGYTQLKDWSEQWVSRIGMLYHLNGERLAQAALSHEWAEAESRLRQFVEEEIHAVWIRELADPDTHHASRDVLKSLERQWDGLTLFLDFPEVALDNNESERLLRTPVVGRKNFYGSGARWSGDLAAMLWTIFATAQMNEGNPILFLTALLDACAANGGRSLDGPELERFFPWAWSEADARAWGRNTS